MRQYGQSYAIDQSSVLHKAQNYLATNRLHTPPMSARTRTVNNNKTPLTSRDNYQRPSRDNTPTTHRQSNIAFAIEQHQKSQIRIEDSIQ